MARAVGLKPLFVRVGCGKTVTINWLENSYIEFGLLPFGGLTFVLTPSLNQITGSSLYILKIRHILYASGGILANYILFLILQRFHELTGEGLFWFLSNIELCTILLNTLPLPSDDNRCTDGVLIASFITQDYKESFREYFSAYETALEHYGYPLRTKSLSIENRLTLVVDFYNAIALLNHQEFDEVIYSLEMLLRNNNLLKEEKCYILDVLSSIVIEHRQTKYLHKADNWSKLALKLLPSSQTLQETRGAILVEAGKYVEGKQMLVPLTASTEIDAAISYCYLFKVDYHLGNYDESKLWLEKAEIACLKYTHVTKILKAIKQELEIS